MKKAFAALAGAAAAVLIVLLGVVTLYHPPTHDNWDMGTPVLTLMALLPAALFGGVIGFVLVDLVGARKAKAAKWVGGSGLLLVVMVLSVRSNRIGYMIDRHGQWHTRAEGRPIPEDPPPDPCFINLSVACQ